MLQPGDVLVVDLFGQQEGGHDRRRQPLLLHHEGHQGRRVSSSTGRSATWRAFHEWTCPRTSGMRTPAQSATSIISGINIPVRIGKTTVMPGDSCSGTPKGVYFIPPALVQQVVDNADVIHVHDEWTRKKFDEGQVQVERDLRHAEGSGAQEGIRRVSEEAARGNPKEESEVDWNRKTI